jgi:hypothetical protein
VLATRAVFLGEQPLFGPDVRERFARVALVEQLGPGLGLPADARQLLPGRPFLGKVERVAVVLVDELSRLEQAENEDIAVVHQDGEGRHPEIRRQVLGQRVELALHLVLRGFVENRDPPVAGESSMAAWARGDTNPFRTTPLSIG